MIFFRYVSCTVALAILLCSLVFPCLAVEPVWNFSNSGKPISDIVISPDGSAVVAGAGKVVLFSRNGTILDKEPYGEMVVQSSNGSVIVTAYASTVYAFRRTTGPEGTADLQKLWDATPSTEPIVSCAVSEKGDRIVVSNGGGGVRIFDGTLGTLLGSSSEYSSRIAISAKGTTVTGIAPSQGLKIYNANGKYLKTYPVSLSSPPNSFFMTAAGTTAVLDDGQYLEALRISNGSVIWRVKAPGNINILAMNAAGDRIVAGTDTGIIALFDGKGTLLWTFDSTDAASGGGRSITTVAMTPDASNIIAGSDTGSVFLLDGRGTVLWTWKEDDSIRKVGISDDGSAAVASTRTTLYLFDTNRKGAPVTTAAPAAVPKSTAAVHATKTTAGNESTGGIVEPLASNAPAGVPETPSPASTGYSVIRTTVQESPLPELTGCIAVFLALVSLRRRP